MKKKNSKQINLRDNKEMLALMKQLYGNDEVKDDQACINTDRKPGTKVVGQVAGSSPATK